MKTLKEIILNYVGEKIKPENDEVTPEMIVQILADEFPELVLLLAEENYLRGYTQALTDKDAVEEDMKKNES